MSVMKSRQMKKGEEGPCCHAVDAFQLPNLTMGTSARHSMKRSTITFIDSSLFKSIQPIPTSNMEHFKSSVSFSLIIT